jgi:hypothetical protein
MSTDAQINANRENAQKSTGPVTAEGKAIVSQNAVKHGLFAVRDVVTTENQAEFDSMREQMLGDLAPVGAMETLLAQRAFSLAWRLQRAETMQTQAIEDMIESHARDMLDSWGRPSKDPHRSAEHLALGRIAKKDWSNSRVIERLFEYERRIENSLYKTIAKLRAIQLMRQMAEADAAEPQHLAQPDAKANSAKQSQSVKTESSSEKLPDRFQQWPDTYGIDPKELIASVQKTYGHRSPAMVEALLKHWNTSPARPKSISGPQTQTSSKKKDLPLSLLKL